MVCDKDKFWFNNYQIIFNKDRLIEFVPTKDMSNSEKLNSLVRLSLYISILFAILKNNYLYFFIFIFMLCITYLIYVFNENIEEFDANTNLTCAKKKCTTSTKNNPFMNPLLTDNRNRGSACNVFDDPNIEETVHNNFKNDLYNDVSDIFNRNNSQRSFYTVPSTTFPNEQNKFANWLYKLPKTCKEGNGFQCVGNNHTPLYNTKGSQYKNIKK